MELAVQSREITGKKVKALRREGLVPAELYGHGKQNLHLAVPVKEFNKVYKAAGSSTIVTLVVGKDKKPAIIHEVGRDYVTGDYLHIDFYEVRMDEKITAKVQIEFVGEAPAVKEKGAVVNRSMAEVEVEALPNDLPHSLVVDLSVLKDLDQSIYVRDIKAPKGVAIKTDADAAVATATPPAPEEVVEAAPADVSTVAAETDEKKAVRDAEKNEGSGNADTK